jgi:serine phosphatase RsbU (regulator of sigma subunit)
MTRRIRAPLVLTLAFLTILIGLLIAGGLFVRSIVAASFRDAERIRSAQTQVQDVIQEQLEEETGVRGYAVLHDRVLLEPYFKGRARLPSALKRVRWAIEELRINDALSRVDDASITSSRWVHQVAFPVLLAHRPRRFLQLRGKMLMDRFRADTAAVEVALARREAAGDARAQLTIFWVGIFTFGAAAAMVLAAALFMVQQYRLAMQLQRESEEAEHERRKSTEMRAAYEAEKRIADTLQEAFAQRVLPQLPTVQINATYTPATEEARVGGDWYDALRLSQERLLVAIGDVAGHGIDAAVAMNKARQTLISYALIDPNPGVVLERVNAELVRDNWTMITAIVGLIDARRFRFAFASAGHPPPVLVEPGHRARLLEFGSIPLGVSTGTQYRTHRVQSVPGAMLVLYTDGAIEHSRDLLEGESLLLEAVESAAQRPNGDAAKAICDGIFGRRRASDDVAILTIRFTDGTVSAVPDPTGIRRSA